MGKSGLELVATTSIGQDTESLGRAESGTPVRERRKDGQRRCAQTAPTATANTLTRPEPVLITVAQLNIFAPRERSRGQKHVGDWIAWPGRRRLSSDVRRALRDCGEAIARRGL
jgi:hypothetical protein